MNPFWMFLLAIFSPLLLAAALFVPLYAGVAAAGYAVYRLSAAHTSLAPYLSDIFYMIEVYRGLFLRWQAHLMETAFLTYTLPLLLLPILGLTLSLWLTTLLSRKLMEVFHLGVGVR